jgi:hypothetical protein
MTSTAPPAPCLFSNFAMDDPEDLAYITARTLAH